MLNKNELQVIKNKDYCFFVCDILDGLKVLSGWEYAEDALDSIRDEEAACKYYKKNYKLKVYTRTYLNSIISK
tara:strand:- start:1825 stop:2043 length:219 start_codon:yes stop_codon:yes gene_type:complete